MEYKTNPLSTYPTTYATFVPEVDAWGWFPNASTGKCDYQYHDEPWLHESNWIFPIPENELEFIATYTGYEVPWPATYAMPSGLYNSLLSLKPLVDFFRTNSADIQQCTTYVCGGIGGPGFPLNTPIPVTHHTGTYFQSVLLIQNSRN
jgi:hypothetical protein